MARPFDVQTAEERYPALRRPKWGRSLYLAVALVVVSSSGANADCPWDSGGVLQPLTVAPESVIVEYLGTMSVTIVTSLDTDLDGIPEAGPPRVFEYPASLSLAGAQSDGKTAETNVMSLSLRPADTHLPPEAGQLWLASSTVITEQDPAALLFAQYWDVRFAGGTLDGSLVDMHPELGLRTNYFLDGLAPPSCVDSSPSPVRFAFAANASLSGELHADWADVSLDAVSDDGSRSIQAELVATAVGP